MVLRACIGVWTSSAHIYYNLCSIFRGKTPHCSTCCLAQWNKAVREWSGKQERSSVLMMLSLAGLWYTFTPTHHFVLFYVKSNSSLRGPSISLFILFLQGFGSGPHPRMIVTYCKPSSVMTGELYQSSGGRRKRNNFACCHNPDIG